MNRDDIRDLYPEEEVGAYVPGYLRAEEETLSAEAQVAEPEKAVPAAETILEEAYRLTHGPRQKDYGHPLDDYTRTAALVSALFAHKLKEPLTAAEMALAMVCVKLSRQVNAPKRDNMTDAAGYVWVSWECLEEAQRRKAGKS